MFEILSGQFEKADQINPGLMEWIKSDSHYTLSTEASRTPFYCTQLEECPVEELNILFDFISDNIVSCANIMAKGTASAYYDSPDWHRNFSIADYWGMWYNKGSSAIGHNHWPYAISFAYYVNCPEGSSPIIIDGNEIQVESGKLILFPGHTVHEVKTCPVDNRFMVAGNIAYLGGLGAGVVQR